MRLAKVYDLYKIVSELPPKSIVLFTVSADRYNDFNLELLKVLVNQMDYSGIYVTINKPYTTLADYLNRNNIPKEKIFFIDVVTKLVAWEANEKERCNFLDAPTDLTGMGIAIEKATEEYKDTKTFLLLDSLSTLFIYNHAEHVTKFMHFLISKLRINNIGGVFISVEEEIDTKVMAAIHQLCDEVVVVK